MKTTPTHCQSATFSQARRAFARVLRSLCLHHQLSASLRAVILFTVCTGVCAFADTPLATYLFENTADASAWTVSGGNSEISIKGNADILPVTEGRLCLQFKMTGVAAGSRYVRNTAPIPVATAITPPVPRRVNVSFSLRSENFVADNLFVRVLEQTSGGVSHWIMNTSDFIRIPASRQWVDFSKIAYLRDDTARLYVYVYIIDGANSTGTVWMDNLRVTSLDANEDFLLEADTGEQGNVFQANIGTMTVNLYDPRVATLSVAIFNQTGAAAPSSQFSVVTDGTNPNKKVITFNERGYYKVQATVTPVAGGGVTKTWNVALIGLPVTPVAPFGIFGVNSDNPLAGIAGAKFNRYFIHFQNVISSGSSYRYTGSANRASSAWLSGSSTVTSTMRYLPASTDHTWIACLGGIPNELLTSGKTPATRRQWEYFSDREKFKAMLKWVLNDLPSYVHLVEVGNEFEWGNWGGTWSELGDYIKAIRETMDEVNADRPLEEQKLKLIGPVFAHLPTIAYPDADTDPVSSYGFASKYLLLDDLLRTQNVIDCLDGISMHAYGSGGYPEDQFVSRIDGFRDYLVSIGAGTLPVYFTEFGWQSGNTSDWQPSVSEIDHASYTSRAWMLLLSRVSDYQIQGALSFCLKHNDSDDIDHYSFLEQNSTPRFPFSAYARTVREVALYTGVRKNINMGADVRAFTAAGATGTLLALWTRTGSTRVVTLSDAAICARDLYGHCISIGTPQQVTASGSPVFVTLNDKTVGEFTDGLSYSMARGATIPVEFKKMIAPPGFSLSAYSSLHVSSTSSLATFKILGYTAGSGWKIYSIIVTAN